jgi:hypothetical protein
MGRFALCGWLDRALTRKADGCPEKVWFDPPSFRLDPGNLARNCRAQPRTHINQGQASFMRLAGQVGIVRLVSIVIPARLVLPKAWAGV